MTLARGLIVAIVALFPSLCWGQTPTEYPDYIAGLPDAGPLQGGDMVPIVRGGVTYKVPVALLGGPNPAPPISNFTLGVSHLGGTDRLK